VCRDPIYLFKSADSGDSRTGYRSQHGDKIRKRPPPLASPRGQGQRPGAAAGARSSGRGRSSDSRGFSRSMAMITSQASKRMEPSFARWPACAK
jgi:hypothetical protein